MRHDIESLPTVRSMRAGIRVRKFRTHHYSFARNKPWKTHNPQKAA